LFIAIMMLNWWPSMVNFMHLHCGIKGVFLFRHRWRSPNQRLN
jgi:hypothetical protein